MGNQVPKVRPGDPVIIVGARGERIECRVLRVRQGGLIDVGKENGELFISSSPYDAAGKKPDSWHLDSPAIA